MFIYPFVIAIHVITCILLVVAVLLQQGKGAEIGAVFGASDTIFGSSGPASFLHKFTAGLAALFMITSFSLTYMSAHRTESSVMQNVEEAPVVPKAPVTTKPPIATKAPIEPVKKGVNLVPTKPETSAKKPGKVSAKKTGVLKTGQAVQGTANKQAVTSGKKQKAKVDVGAGKPSPVKTQTKTPK